MEVPRSLRVRWLLLKLKLGSVREETISELGALRDARALLPLFKVLTDVSGWGTNVELEDPTILALMRIGVPARELASEILQHPLDQYSSTAAAALLGAWTEAESVIRLVREGKHGELRMFGEKLCQEGGSPAMEQVAYRVKALGGSMRNLELAWEGICGWRF